MSRRTAPTAVESISLPTSRENPLSGWSDAQLVEACILGKQDAWSALIDKYKRLIFSIPFKYELSHDQATDIFQDVCLELLSALPKLREPKALPQWIIQVTAHKCLRQKRQGQRMESSDADDNPVDAATPPVAEAVLREVEEEQHLRGAISSLPDRCRRLVEMLFFEEPARPYAEIARTLGIATGSIGFIRQRCLDRLRKRLVEAGFP